MSARNIHTENESTVFQTVVTKRTRWVRITWSSVSQLSKATIFYNSYTVSEIDMNEWMKTLIGRN